MEDYSENAVLISALASILEKWTVPNDNAILTGFDVIGYFYSIPLLSLAKHNREQNLDLLNRLCDKLIAENNENCNILLRNMTNLPLLPSPLIILPPAF